MAITHNTRRALDAIELIEQIRAGLNKEKQPRLRELATELQEAIADLNEVVKLMNEDKAPADVKSELKREGMVRSLGQQDVQERLAPCKANAG